MFDLTGKCALVTGASGGIGSDIARALHAQGATVALSGTRREALDALAAELGGRTHVLPCNLSDSEAVDALPRQSEEAMGSLDILVNNAGLTRDNLFMRMKDEEWDEVIRVNLTAAFRLSRASLRGMMKRRYGRIIGITSVVGVMGNPGQGNYAASKAGMIGMMKSLAQEVASRNITANCTRPRFHPLGHDRCAERRTEGPYHDDDSRRTPWRSQRNRRRSGLSGQRRGRLCHRPDVACKWRHGHDLTIRRQPETGIC